MKLLLDNRALTERVLPITDCHSFYVEDRSNEILNQVATWQSEVN